MLSIVQGLRYLLKKSTTIEQFSIQNVPTKDKCDICEEQQMSKNISPELLTKFENHVNDKTKTKAERDLDRQSDSIVLCFDLENVIPCPRAEVSNFFYKRKIKVII
jgi:hypothetical protein